MTLDDKTIAELEALLAKATPGEWHAGDTGAGWELHRGPKPPECFTLATECKALNDNHKGRFYTRDDPEAIAALHNAAPALLAAAKRCRVLEEACKLALPHLRDMVARGQVPGEDTSHYGDARAVKAIEAALEDSDAQ